MGTWEGAKFSVARRGADGGGHAATTFPSIARYTAYTHILGASVILSVSPSPSPMLVVVVVVHVSFASCDSCHVISHNIFFRSFVRSVFCFVCDRNAWCDASVRKRIFSLIGSWSLTNASGAFVFISYFWPMDRWNQSIESKTFEAKRSGDWGGVRKKTTWESCLILLICLTSKRPSTTDTADQTTTSIAIVCIARTNGDSHSIADNELPFNSFLFADFSGLRNANFNSIAARDGEKE